MIDRIDVVRKIANASISYFSINGLIRNILGLVSPLKAIADVSLYSLRSPNVGSPPTHSDKTHLL